MWKLTTSQTAILFPLYYDGNNLNQMNVEMNTTSCTVLQRNKKASIC